MWPYEQAWLYYYKLPLWAPQYYIIRHGQQTYISGLFSQMKDDILKSEKGEGTEIPCDHRVVINVIWFIFLDERMTAYLKICFYCLVSHIVVSWYWSVWVHPRVFSGFRVTRSLLLCEMFCSSLFVLLFFFFWPLCCLSFFFWPLCCLSFFDIQILINPLVSSNSSLISFFFFII